jgi:hypothetical protein
MALFFSYLFTDAKYSLKINYEKVNCYWSNVIMRCHG